MDETFKIDQFSIEDGKWQPQPGNIASIQAASSRSFRGQGDLYICVQLVPSAPVPAALLRSLRESATKHYYGGAGSMTRRLRAALLAASTLVYEQNLRLDIEHRLMVGLTYAVLREREVYLGQIGPALAVLHRQGRLELYPPASIWLQSASPSMYEIDRFPAAGVRPEIEPDLFHISLQAGDTLVLSVTDLARTISGGDLAEALSPSGGESAARRIEDLAGGHDISVLIIQAGDGSTASQPPFTERVSSSAAAIPAGPGAAPETTMTTIVPWAEEMPTLPETPTPDHALADRSAGHPVRNEPPAPPVTEPALREGVTRKPSESQQPYSQGAVPAEQSVTKVSATVPWDELRDNVSYGAERVRQRAEDLFMRVLPETGGEGVAPALPAPRALSLPWRAVLAVALAIPLVMAFMVIMTRMQYERTERVLFRQIQEVAESRFDTAMALENPTHQRQALRDALASVQEGLAVVPDDRLLVSLQGQIEHKLDTLDHTVRLYHFWRLAEVEDSPTSELDSSHLVIQDQDVFLLNRGSDRVYHYTLNNAGDALQPAGMDATLMQTGQLHDGVRLGDLIDITWMEANGQRTQASLALLDRSGSLFSYDAQRGIDVTPVANSDGWVKPIAVGCYYGNIYVLDPIRGSILKYIPTDNAYVNPPSDYVSPQLDIDLTGAVDMAIDGSVYVLFADGRIIKLFKGELQSFDMRGLPSPMRSPTSLVVSGEQEPEAPGRVYVADTGNERILEFDKAGNYIRQFRARTGVTQMHKMRGIYVDAQRNRLFVLSDRTLWLTELPALGEP